MSGPARSMKSLGIAFAAMLLFGAGMQGIRAPSSGPAGSAVLIKDVRIFDGENAVPNGGVLIEGGRIAAVGPDLAAAPDAEVIDGAGRTILPGLFDAHVHIVTGDALKSMIVFGVTSTIDMFMDVGVMKTVHEAQAEGPLPGQAFLVSPGTLVTVPGGHGTQFGLPIPTVKPETDIQNFVDDRLAEGSQFIKIIQDDGSTYKMPWPTLSDAQVEALIAAAHKRGKQAVIHAASLENCLHALRAGVDGLAHLHFDGRKDPGFGALAARQKAFVIPTLSILRSMSGRPHGPELAADQDLAPWLGPAEKQGLNRPVSFTTGAASYAADEEALRRMRDAGVRILAGTDAPNPGTWYGVSLHGELELLVKAGLTPIQALRAATSAPADSFGVKNRGRLRPGFVADAVLVEGDPTADIRATRRIVAVWKDGARVDRAGYLKSVEDARRAEEAAKSAPPPEYGSTGLVSDFEEGKIAAVFGAGWMISTDVFYGGKSQATMEWAAGGAGGSKGAMKIEGEILEGAAIRWAGAMFSPGASLMAPVNLSARKGISFKARGEGRSFAVMIFAQTLGFTPAMRTFAVGPEWKEVVLPFSEFKLDGAGVMAVFIGASNDLGKFTLWIDDVRLD